LKTVRHTADVSISTSSVYTAVTVVIIQRF